MAQNRYFGLPRGHRKQTFSHEQDIPEDAYGEEMGPNARVWRMYLREASAADAEMVEGWRDTTDVLLVFAGLFSAIVTTLVVQTSQNLQPDNSLIIASLLQEQIQIQRAIGSGSSIAAIPSSSLSTDSGFDASTVDVLVNGLWFVCLALSLSAALGAVLVKQWIQHYISAVSGTSRDQVRLRQFRWMGLESWRVPAIVGWLPTFLHIALLLFFLGLVLFLSSLNRIITCIVGVIVGITYVAYIAVNVIPLRDMNCPYRTPLTNSAYTSSRFLYSKFIRIRRLISRIMGTHGYCGLPRSLITSCLEARDDGLIHERVDEMDAQALMWLFTYSSNPDIYNTALEAISGLRVGFTRKEIILNGQIAESLQHNILTLAAMPSEFLPAAKAERILRARLQLEPTMVSYPAEEFNLLQKLTSSTYPKFLAIYLAHSCCIDQSPVDAVTRNLLRDFLEAIHQSNIELPPFFWARILINGTLLARQTPSWIEYCRDWSYGLNFLRLLPPRISVSTPSRMKAPRSPVFAYDTVVCTLQDAIHILTDHIIMYLHALYCPSSTASPLIQDSNRYAPGGQGIDIPLLYLQVIASAIDASCQRVELDFSILIPHLEYLFQPPFAGQQPRYSAQAGNPEMREVIISMRVRIQSFLQYPTGYYPPGRSREWHCQLLRTFGCLCDDFMFLGCILMHALTPPEITPNFISGIVEIGSTSPSFDFVPLLHILNKVLFPNQRPVSGQGMRHVQISHEQQQSPAVARYHCLSLYVRWIDSLEHPVKEAHIATLFGSNLLSHFLPTSSVSAIYDASHQQECGRTAEELSARKEALSSAIRLTRDHHYFKFKDRANYLRALQLLFSFAQELPSTEESTIYEYLCGDDLSGARSRQDLYLDGWPQYAPICVPFVP